MTNEADSIILDVEYENGTNFSLGATTDNLPPGVLYRVKATYKYRREDVDELSFDVGDIIRVVEYDDPEEQVCILIVIHLIYTNMIQHNSHYHVNDSNNTNSNTENNEKCNESFYYP